MKGHAQMGSNEKEDGKPLLGRKSGIPALEVRVLGESAIDQRGAAYVPLMIRSRHGGQRLDHLDHSQCREYDRNRGFT